MSSVSPAVGSTEGDLTVRITGSYYERGGINSTYNPTRVYIGGENLLRFRKAKPQFSFVHCNPTCFLSYHIYSAIRRGFGFLRRNLVACPQDVKESAYKGLVYPVLEYVSSVWAPNMNLRRCRIGQLDS